MTTDPNGAAPLAARRAQATGLGLLVACLFALPGCTSVRDWGSATSTRNLLPDSSRTIAQSFADIAQAQRDLSAELESKGQVTPPPEDDEVPEHLSTTTLNLAMRDARASSLLWLLADELHVNLVMDAPVAALQRTATLQLKGVSAKEALRRICQAFDIHGRFESAGVLRVSLLQDRVFELELSTSGRTGMTLSSGGDVLGAGRGTQSQTVQDMLQFDAKVGEPGDDVQPLQKMLEAIIPSSPADSTDGAPASHFAIDRGRSLLYLSARPSQVAAVARMLDQASQFNRRQVRLDVQLLDVTLKDEFQFGIDWTAMGRYVAATAGPLPATLAQADALFGGNLPARTITIPGATTGAGNVGSGLILGNDHVSAALQALRQYGDVKLLSSPTVRLKNGGHAFMSVGTTQRYVQQTKASRALGQGFSTTSVEVVTDSVFSGIVIGVSAYVRKDGRIELFLRPSQTLTSPETLELVDVGNGARVSLPRTEGKTMATTLEVADGDTVILGGLIDITAAGVDRGLPGLADTSAGAALFGRTSRGHNTREMVMVARVHRL